MEDEESNLVNWKPAKQGKPVRCPRCRTKLHNLAKRDCGLCLGTGTINETVATAYRLGGLDAVKDYMRSET